MLQHGASFSFYTDPIVKRDASLRNAEMRRCGDAEMRSLICLLIQVNRYGTVRHSLLHWKPHFNYLKFKLCRYLTYNYFK